MNISEPFIRRPVATALLSMGLALLGVVAYTHLPVASLPRVDFPMISVTALLPGADPTTVASSLAAPLERRFGQISAVTEMTSTSTLGGTLINIQFDLNRLVDNAARDVQAAINAAANELPPNLPNPPTYRKVNPADAPICVLGLTSPTRPSSEVYEAADEVIAQRLSQIEGVSQVIISGAEKSAVRVRMNPVALASAGLSLEDVRTFLGSANVNSPKGSIDSPRQALTLATNDQLFLAEEYESLILQQKNGVPILLRGMGSAIDDVENNKIAGWSGMQRAVLIIIFKQPGANVIETVERIYTVLPQLQKWISPSIKIETLSDRTVTIRASVEEVQFTLLITVALVVMVIFLFLRRLWPTVIASITVPLSLAGTFAGMYLLDYSLDNLSLMAITVSVGFVVDDAIVVIENVYRYIEEGDPPLTAALKGAKQIGFTVVSMSTSLVAVFIPLLFMGGLMGRLFHEFAVTLSLAIFVSGVISLTLTPMLCSRFLRREADAPKPVFVARVSERAFTWLLGHYETALRWVLGHQIFMLLVALVTLLATLWLYIVVPKGFFPQQDTGLIIGITEAAQDVSFEEMERLQKSVARVVLDDPAVATLGSFIGASAAGTTVNNGRMYITLKPLEERKINADQTIDRLREKLAGVVGISLFLQPVQDIRVGGRLTKAQFQYALQSADLNDLNHWASLLLERIQKIPQIRDASSDQLTRGLQSDVKIDRDAAGRLGLSPSSIDNALYDAFGQRQVSTMYKRYNQHYVVLEADPPFQLYPASLDKIYIRSTTTGQMVPLSSVASFGFSNTYLSVNHQGQFPAVTLSFNLAPGVSLGEAAELIRKATEELNIPARIQRSFQGTAQVFEASLATMPVLFLAAVVTVYIVLGMLYESLIHPVTILSTLPSAGVGALVSLIFFGYDLSLVSAIGIILLIGIVKKNAIMMVDFALEAERGEGLPPEESIYKACVIRFRPIMMTTMAALLGAVPLAIGFGIGSELRRPLGIAIVGGLIVSQTLTLFTTPVVYLGFEHLREWARRKRAKPVPPEVI